MRAVGFASMERFSTDRLTAEKLCGDHLADLIELHLDPLVSRYLGGVRSPETTTAYLADNIAHWDRHGFGLWVLRTKAGEFAGRAGLRHLLVEGVEEIEIVYTFKRTLWGQGLASEIAEALTSIGLLHLRLPSLVALVSIENAASRRVLGKLNYTLERRAMYEEAVLYRLSGAVASRRRVRNTVGALFIRQNGEVLLGLRAASKSSWPLHWDSIGGRVEEGETLDGALVREVQEEVGVTPTGFSLVAVIRERQPEIYGDALHHVYAVTSWQGGDPSNISDEHSELKWFDISAMRGLTNIVDPDYCRYALQAMTRKIARSDI